jgi:hypothetical protein
MLNLRLKKRRFFMGLDSFASYIFLAAVFKTCSPDLLWVYRTFLFIGFLPDRTSDATQVLCIQWDRSLCKSIFLARHEYNLLYGPLGYIADICHNKFASCYRSLGRSAFLVFRLPLLSWYSLKLHSAFFYPLNINIPLIEDSISVDFLAIGILPISNKLCLTKS